MTPPPGEGSGDRSGESGLPPARIPRPVRPVVPPDSTQGPPPADAPPPPTVPAADLPRRDPDPPRTVVGPDGEHWIVDVMGRGRTGTPPDRGAPLLLLRFRPEGEPSREGEVAHRERLVVAGTLAGISDADLQAALAEATPPRPPD